MPEPDRAVVEMTDGADRAARQFLSLLQRYQLREMYPLTAPAYRKSVTLSEHLDAMAFWRQQMGAIQRTRLVDRAVGIDARGRYVKLTYRLDGSRFDCVALFTFVPHGDRWLMYHVRWERGAAEPGSGMLRN